jgi:predicted nucleotidyltransferase
MSKTEAKTIIKKYTKKLRDNNYPVSSVYLFGSHAKGGAHAESDIDVAVVSNKLKRNREKARFLLWDMRMDVDTRIEPHGFSVADFKNDTDPMVYEIKKTGIKVV